MQSDRDMYGPDQAHPTRREPTSLVIGARPGTVDSPLVGRQSTRPLSRDCDRPRVEALSHAPPHTRSAPSPWLREGPVSVGPSDDEPGRRRPTGGPGRLSRSASPPLARLLSSRRLLSRRALRGVKPSSASTRATRAAASRQGPAPALILITAGPAERRSTPRRRSVCTGADRETRLGPARPLSIWHMARPPSLHRRRSGSRCGTYLETRDGRCGTSGCSACCTALCRRRAPAPPSRCLRHGATGGTTAD